MVLENIFPHGMKPHPVPLDDFYVDRDKTPKDADGKLDFECLEALDIDRFNNDMTSLLNGDATELPVFNFKTGKREEKGRMMQLGEEDVLVIEGIHGLNDSSVDQPGLEPGTSRL